MTRADWIVSLYAGAAWGGLFWLVVPLVTTLIGSRPLPSSSLLWTRWPVLRRRHRRVTAVPCQQRRCGASSRSGTRNRRAHRLARPRLGGAVVNDETSQRIPAQPLLGFVLGAISGVIYPGLLAVPILPWMIPAGIAGVLSLSPRMRGLAVGFGAASVGWIAFAAAFGIVPLLAPLVR